MFMKEVQPLTNKREQLKANERVHFLTDVVPVSTNGVPASSWNIFAAL
jgi:hypothetical protein